ncbi:MAG: aldo/keto reductase [Candidatus Spyradosoma sp.]
MPRRTLGGGNAALTVSAVGLGCMGMTHGHGEPRDRRAMRNLIAEAVDLGVDFFDTAEIYGPHTNEELVGEALEPYRGRVFIGSKFGLYYPGGRQLEDARPERIRLALEGSLKRLRTDHIDIYYQHRIDEKVPIEDVAGTMSELAREGKILRWGLSEPRPETIRRAHRVFPVTAVENQYAMTFRRHEEATFAVFEELGVGLVAYSPLDRGYLGGLMDGNTRFDPANDMRANFPRMQPEAMEKNRAIIDFLDEIGREKNATCAQIALAWILERKPWIVPIPETTQRPHLLENVRAANIVFTPEERSRIAAFLEGFVPAGERYVPGSPAAKSVWNLI